MHLSLEFFLLVVTKMWEHLQLTFSSLIIAMVIAIPLGVFLTRGHRPILRRFLLKTVAIVQTIPGLALLALVVVLLVSLRSFFLFPVTGFFPSIIVLTLYALLPILSNTCSGLRQVNPTLIEVAEGIGMTKKQILFLVELPLAFPLILGGVRLSLVWTVGLVTLTSLIGAGGLGDLIMQGLRRMDASLILAGTIPAALLAIFLDILVAKIGCWLIPQRMA